MDISPDQRHLVYDYIINRFGKEKTAYILASGTVNDKGCIDEIGRALSYRDKDSIYTLDKVKQVKQEYGNDPEKARRDYPDLFYYFDGLNGTVVSQSMHPAGIVASPINLIDNYGCFVNSEGKQVLYINMEEVHETGLVKYDILGLRNVQIIRDTCELAGISYPKSHEVNWNDNNVWEYMVKSPVGIFQFESDFAFKSLQKMSPHSINDMSLTNAALRPSGESYRERLFNKEINHNPSEQIDELLAGNYGYLVFQEDVIKFLQDICGLSGSDADNVRRAIGRKQVDRLQKALPQIFEGYCSKSTKPREVAEQEAKTFLQIIEDSSNYMFGYNHSTGYSMIGYLCAYLRYYYPIEFCTALLNNANNDEDLTNGNALIKQLNIRLSPPLFRHSRSNYFFNKAERVIYQGLSSIKNMSASTAEALYSMRNMKFKNFVQFLFVLQDIPGKPDSRQLDILIKIGFFDEFAPANVLLKAVDVFNKYHKCKTIKVEQWISSNYPLDILCKISEKVTEKMASGINNYAAVIAALRNTAFLPTSISDRIKWQVKYLGYSTLSDQSANANDWVVVSVDVTKYGTANARLYNIVYGVERTYKCNKKYWASHPFQAGDVIRAAIDDKPKYKKGEDGGWVKTGETEKYLKLWAIMDQNNA